MSVARADCSSPSAAAPSVQECVTKDTIASKSRFSWNPDEWLLIVNVNVHLLLLWLLG